ncbi:MAG: EcsC family protein [Pseudomonadota bacterium]
MTFEPPVEILSAPLSEEEVEARISELADYYAGAGGIGIQLLNAMGGQAEAYADRLPDAIQTRLGEATESALRVAMETAHLSRDVVDGQPGWLTRVLTTTMGAAGGMGGLPTALAELPVTTTVLLRAIQDVAVENGFNPREDAVHYDCIQVFASAGPLEHDDGANFAFLSTRMTVTGPALQRLVSTVAPKLATVLGQKLAAQTIPVLGAAAGAATNYAYTQYYQQMAEVHFGLRRLAIEADLPHDTVLASFRKRASRATRIRG